MAATKRNSLIVAAIFLIHHLTLWQRADDTGRIGSDGRRQVYLHAAGRAPVLIGEVRPDEAPELPVHCRRRP